MNDFELVPDTNFLPSCDEKIYGSITLLSKVLEFRKRVELSGCRSSDLSG